MSPARPGFRLVIFDMDGTLVDSGRDIAAALNVGLEAAGLKGRPIRELLKFIGRPLGEIFAGLGTGGDEGLTARAVGAYRTFYHDHCADSTRPYPGVSETLGSLRGLGCATAVATTKITPVARHVASVLGLDRMVDWVQGTDDFPAKPDPSLFLKVLDHFDIPPEFTASVGDTPHDIRAARAAGLTAWGVTYGNGSREEMVAEGADALFDHIGDLLLLGGFTRQPPLS